MSTEVLPEIQAEPVHPKSWPPHPPKKMIMSPAMAVFGGLLAFFTVVFMVVVLPTTTFEPDPSENWRPLTDLEMQGRNVFLANGCIYCHSGFVRPQDVYASQYYVYSRAAEPGDYMGDGETPNLFGTIRTGPDLSNAGGFHPDNWHYAHYYNPRYTTPLSIMPQFNFLSEEDARALIAFTQSRGGHIADLRVQHQNNMTALEMASGNVAADGENGDRTDGYPAASAIKNLMLIDRGYWFADNPLPVTTENLLRGRQVFQERCIACHGSQGDGNGPGAFYLNPPPAAFNAADDQQHGSDTSPGAYYWRILRGLPGSAMENFGTRLTVDDIWKVTLFLKTIPNGGLTAEIPTPDMYIQWRGYPGLFEWANCFAPDQDFYMSQDSVDSLADVTNYAQLGPDVSVTPSALSGSALSANTPYGIGDVPGIVAEGTINPVYATVLWEIQNNARPCGTAGYEDVTLHDVLADAQTQADGFALQGTDQIQFIPPDMFDMSQMPPQWLAQVWDQPNPLIASDAGNN
ncbi:MAG: cbb3-type cytochrome c oxidase subunit II [Anaerolineae bacterium]|nr:cbb3-type cytochrome c oxidase subunit II [Anaerolineae bacterium]